MSRDLVSLQLDVRQLGGQLDDASAFLQLWARVAPELLGQALSPHQEVWVADELGPLGLQVMSLPPGFERVSKETEFAVHSVVEPARVVHRCGVCDGLRQRTHAPFRCYTCNEESAEPRAGHPATGASPKLCADHVVILEGSLRGFCPTHAPTCHCGSLAAAWCFGPACVRKKGRTFCAQHLQPHPKIPDLYYCAECYAIEFPPCETPGCDSFGTIRCCHVDPNTEKPCNRAYCAEHAKRWQVFGPHKIGLGRCPAHSDLKTLPDADVIFQVAAGTEVRRQQRSQQSQSRKREEWIRLPSLQAIGHILTKARERAYRPNEINSQIETLIKRLDASRPLQGRMLNSLNAHSRTRKQNLQRDADERAQGLPHFEGLVNLVRRDGFDELAASLSYSDFRPKHNLLFIRLPAEYRPMFIGKRGHRITSYQERLGVKINFEKGSD